MTFKRTTIYLSLSAGIASCASAPVANEHFNPAYASALPLCELLAHSSEHVGDRVDVRGLFALIPHGRVLFDRDCSSMELNVELEDSPGSLEDDRRITRLFHETGNVGVKTVYSGLLKSKPAVVVDSDPKDLEYTIVGAKLEAAEWNLRRE